MICFKMLRYVTNKMDWQVLTSSDLILFFGQKHPASACFEVHQPLAQTLSALSFHWSPSQTC